MPNWCSNWISISGDKKGMKQLKSIFNEMDENTERVFEKLIGRSRPDLDAEEWEKGAWYDGNIGHFGCKWDVNYSSLNLEVGDDCITISPETAWSPPTEFCRQLTDIYGVDVVIEYSEGGCDFAGRATFTPDGEQEENYSYREGLYVLDGGEMFFNELEFDIECELDLEPEDRKTPEEFADEYPYVSEEDRKEIISQYKEKLEEFADSE